MGVPTKRTDATRTTGTRTGRPTKRNAKVMKTIVEAIREGATFTLAAAAGGISYETFNEWRKLFSDFSEMVDAAVAESALFHLRNIKEHATDDWRASAWVMEHRFPHDYGRSVQEQEHRGGLSINFNLSKRALNAEEQKERASEAQETGA